MSEEKDPRIEAIVQGRREGKSYTEISKDLEVSRRTIYNLRSTDSYFEVVNDLFLDLMSDIERFAVDQFLMRGGTVVVATSPFDIEIAGALSVRKNESGLIKDDERPGFYKSGRFFYATTGHTFLLTAFLKGETCLNE